MTCSSCRNPVDPATVVGGVACCPSCGQVFEAQVADGLFVPPSPPDGALVRASPHGVVVDLPWVRDVNALGIALQLGFSVIPVAMVWGTWSLWWCPALLASGFLAYNLLTNVVNATTILIAGDRVQVYHGPLPTLGNWAGTLRLSHLRGVRVDKVVSTSRGRFGTRRTTKYQLEGPFTSGPLLKDWNHEQTLDFVQQVFEGCLLVADPSRRP